jgi:hypothetical protein
MNRCVNVPAAPLLVKPEHGAEMADEVLYGTKIEVLDKARNGFRYVRTEYGYEGFVYNENFTESDYGHGRSFIYAPFADVVRKPDVRERVMLSLHRGSCVEVLGNENGWASVRLAEGGIGYIRSRHLELCDKGIIETAFGYLGVPYRWGGKTAMGIDCSGLAFMAYYLNGITIYRDSSIEESMKKGFAVRKIPFESAKPADLLYFPGHIAIYLGEGWFIHSSFANDGVSVNSFNQNDAEYREDLKKTLICAGTADNR